MKSILALVMMLALMVGLQANAAAESPEVNPPSVTSHVGSGLCKTCEDNSFNKQNSCYRNFSSATNNKNCPATYEKVVDGAENTDPTTNAKPASK